MIYITIIMLFIISAVSAYTDLKYGVIKNRVVLVGVLGGLILGFINNGLEGVIKSLFGIVIPFIILFILFAIGGLGAGDIKLICALGSLMGAKFAVNNFILSIGISFIMLLLNSMLDKNTFKKIKEFFFSISNMVLAKKITDFTTKDKKKGIPFAVSIFISIIFQIVFKVKIF